MFSCNAVIKAAILIYSPQATVREETKESNLKYELDNVIESIQHLQNVLICM